MTAGDKMALTLRPAEARDAPALIEAHLASRALHGDWVQLDHLSVGPLPHVAIACWIASRWWSANSVSMTRRRSAWS